MAVLKKGTCYHGNAGIASAFAALADKKLKSGGVLAMVMPLSVASGVAWRGFRQMMESRYSDLHILSIAAYGMDMSFSSDTGMAECLVIASRDPRAKGPSSPQRARFTSLRHRPQDFAEASAMATNMANCAHIRGLDDGPYGGTSLVVGDEVEGEMLTSPIKEGADNWGGVRLMDYSVAQTAYELAQAKLSLPGSSSALEIKTVLLGEVGELGTYHLDIIGPAPRGPFDKMSSSPTATYPSLWNHNAKNEKRIVCEPDSQLVVRSGMEEKAATVWATASRSHLNLDFRFNSQPLNVALTERLTVGGRAWPNVAFDDKGLDCAFAIWGNSTLGLLCHWWHSNRQQPGRGIVTIRSAESLPVLDFRTLTDEQLSTAESIFDEFRDKDLKPAHLADVDPNRALLDRRVICDLLDFDESVYEAVRRLSAKWCAEPSVHGGKKS